jgi:hypothetical protein
LYVRDNCHRSRSRDRKRNLCPTAFAFSLCFELVVSIQAGKMISTQNTRCREDILQAQSKFTQKGSVTIHVEVLYTMTLENDTRNAMPCLMDTLFNCI